MEKILLYGNDWEDFKKFIFLVEKIEKEGFEVAVASDVDELRRLLAIGKLLVVNPDTYNYTYYSTIEEQPLGKDNHISYDDLLEMLK